MTAFILDFKRVWSLRWQSGVFMTKPEEMARCSSCIRLPASQKQMSPKNLLSYKTPAKGRLTELTSELTTAPDGRDSDLYSSTDKISERE